MQRIFISSAQKELAAERRALKDYVHRDYTSTGSVQVMLFAARLEVWNPGSLPSVLTLAKLREPHGSFPANPLLAEPLYLAKYIERMGTGTRDMIRLCREAGLREPEFAVRDGFVQTLWRPPQPESQPELAKPTPEVTPKSPPKSNSRIPSTWNNWRLRSRSPPPKSPCKSHSCYKRP